MDTPHTLPHPLVVETTLILEPGVSLKFNASANANLDQFNSRTLVADETSNFSLFFDSNAKPFRPEDRQGLPFHGCTIDAVTVLDHCPTGYNRGNPLMRKCPLISNPQGSVRCT